MPSMKTPTEQPCDVLRFRFLSLGVGGPPQRLQRLQAIPGYVLLLMPVVYGITGQPPFNTEITPYFSCELRCLPLCRVGIGWLNDCYLRVQAPVALEAQNVGAWWARVCTLISKLGSSPDVPHCPPRPPPCSSIVSKHW